MWCCLTGLAKCNTLQRCLAGFFKRCTTNASSAIVGDRAHLGGLDSSLSMASVSSVEGGDEGRKKAPDFNCTFLPVCLISSSLGVVARLWELRWVVGLSVHGERTSVV